MAFARISMIFFVLLIGPYAHAGVNYFQNTKEPTDPLISKHEWRESVAQLQADPTLQTKLDRILNFSSTDQACEETVMALVEEQMSGFDRPQALELLRVSNNLDNSSFRILKSFYQKTDGKIFDRDLSQISIGPTDDPTMVVFSRYQNWLAQGACLMDSAKQLYFSLMIRQSDNKSKMTVKSILKMAHQAQELGKISEQSLAILKFSLKQHLHLVPLTLSEHAYKLAALAEQFPQSKLSTPAQITVMKSGQWNHLSLREDFLQRYDVEQIKLLAQTLVKMRKRFESQDIEIHINYNGQDQDNQSDEVITLDPVERYNFVVKIFRKEWAELEKQELFVGKHIRYTDFLLAGFETGIVASQELDQLLALSEIWDTKISVAKKIWHWSALVGKIGAGFIPAPFGFIAVMGIVVIDGIVNLTEQQQKLKQEKNKTVLLF